MADILYLSILDSSKKNGRSFQSTLQIKTTLKVEQNITKKGQKWLRNCMKCFRAHKCCKAMTELSDSATEWCGWKKKNNELAKRES